ncbi:MAG: PTS sugar transporter subunit IIC [Eggerthellaceae bacterium]|nr:PTS sugar transporter subunit IIC [Eggerthellaceae bacterium]
MQEFFQNTILPAVMKFVNTRGIRAVKDGLVYSMPLIIVGAVYLLLFQLPVPALASFVEGLGVVPYLSHGYTSSFAITGMIAALGVAYQWAKNEGLEPFSAAIISLSVFLIFIPDYIAGAGPDGANVAGLDKTWLGGQGMIGAIIAGLVTGLVYSWFIKKDIRIRMPEGVPDGVAAAFTGLIPAACLITGATVIFGICDALFHVTPIELIYKFLQTPLQGFGDSLVGVAVFESLIPLLWWFGVHGATVVGSVSSPIATANMLENQAIFEKLTAQGMSRAEAIAALPANGGHIFTDPFVNCFQAITGSGLTMGLVIFMVFFAKSAQMKQVGKLGLGSGIFNINEPILFGTPIVMNPTLFIPFVASPLIGNVLAYILTMIGFIPYTIGVTVPWTTPPILSGLLCIGWQGALMQIIEIAISFFLYLPFARAYDKELLAAELGEEA